MTETVATIDPYDALAALDWQIELGADEAIGDEPVNRYEVKPAPKPQATKPIPEEHARAEAVVSVPATENLAASCDDLDALRASIAAFDGCELKQGARNLVFADGVRGARVMIVGEVPGREEDMQGTPFVGQSGQLLDKMFAAIGLSRKADDPMNGVYVTNILPWRTPQNRDPSNEELAMMTPFLHRHIELAAPEILVTMGSLPTKILLKTAHRITRLRGNWTEVQGLQTLPMFHPEALLRDPLKKREAWADLLALKARLK